MRHLAAYLLLVAGGNESPTAEDISTLLGTVGIEASDERLVALISELEGKDVNELIALGSTKLSTMGGGGGGGGGGAPASSAPAAASGAPAAEAKVEEKAKPKEEEVDALDGGMDMFGGGGGGGGDY